MKYPGSLLHAPHLYIKFTEGTHHHIYTIFLGFLIPHYVFHVTLHPIIYNYIESDICICNKDNNEFIT